MSPEQEQLLLLKKESKVRLPDPNEVFNLGYGMHVADDPYARKHARLAAHKNMRDHYKLEPRDDMETGYLQAVRNNAVALSRSLTRRKTAWLEDLENAKKEYEIEVQKLVKARTDAALFSFGWGLFKTGIVGAIGYLVARAIGAFLPADLVSETGTKWPSIVVAAMFIWAFRLILSIWSDLRRSEVDNRYRQRISEANNVYAEGKLREARQYYDSLRRAWQQYTGEEYDVPNSYLDVMESDIVASQLVQRRLNNSRALVIVQRVMRLQRRMLMIVLLMRRRA